MKKVKQTYKVNKTPLIILGISLLLITIGIFGSQFVDKLYTSVEFLKEDPINYGLNYYFKDLWNILINYEGVDKSINIFICITDLITYFLLIGGLVFIFISLIRNKDNIDINHYFRLLSGIIIPHLSILMINHYYRSFVTNNGSYYNMITTYGWGSILIIIGYFLSFIALLIDEYPLYRGNTSIYIMKNIVRVSLMILPILAFKSLYVATYDGTILEYGISRFISSCLIYNLDGRTCLLFALYTLILSFISIGFILDYLSQKEPHLYKRHIVLTALVLVFIIANGLFGKYGTWDSFADERSDLIHFPYPLSSILGIILTSLVLVLTIILRVKKDKIVLIPTKKKIIKKTYNGMVSSDYRQIADEQCYKTSKTLVLTELLFALIMMLVGALGVIPGTAGAISSLILFFTIGPINFSYVCIAKSVYEEEKCKTEDLFSGFKRYPQAFVLSTLEGLMLLGWTLLLVVPGIIKSYSYACSKYISYDDNDITAVDSITESRKLMDGHKAKLFYLDISYIGWYLLGILTLGILLLWVVPKHRQARYNFYLELIKHKK